MNKYVLMLAAAGLMFSPVLAGSAVAEDAAPIGHAEEHMDAAEGHMDAAQEHMDAAVDCSKDLAEGEVLPEECADHADEAASEADAASEDAEAAADDMDSSAH